jgi:hypothetical protein
MQDRQQNRRRDALNISLMMKQIDEMRQAVKNGEKNLSVLQDTYSYLYTKTPSLFMMIRDNNLEDSQIPMLFKMLFKVEDIQEGKLDAYETDVEIGKELAEKYIYNVINNK